MSKQKSWHYLQVLKFMQKAGQETPDKPCIPSEEVRLLRAKLILEEALETVAALGVDVRPEPNTMLVCDGKPCDLEFEISDNAPDLEQIVDGCCDTIVVMTGTLIACGVADVGPQQLVDESNLAKFEEGSYRRDDGKWIKPPNWQAPDLVGELKRQGWEG